MTSATILTMHGLTLNELYGPKQSAAAARYTVTAAKFQHIVAEVAKNSPGTVADFLGQQTHVKTVLTFDDGLESDYAIALPILQEQGIAATFFVTANNIGRSGYLKAEQVREMAVAGMEIGSHGLEHQYLVTLPRVAAEREISESKDRIEQILGRTIVSFAAVGGHYKPWMIDYAALSGYKAFAGMVPGKSRHPLMGIATLRRNHVQAHHSLSYITSLVEGHARIMARNILRYRILELPKVVLGMEGYDLVKARLLNLLSR